MDSPSVPSDYWEPDANHLMIAAAAAPEPSLDLRNQLLTALDHTFLENSLEDGITSQRIATLCREAKDTGFYAVCVRPQWVSTAKALLENTPVKVVTVIGFPEEKTTLQSQLMLPTIGEIPTAIKLSEIKEAIEDGADELDIVLNVKQFKHAMAQGFEPTQVLEELYLLTMVSQGRPVKLIVETDLLTSQEIEKITLLCTHVGLSFIKTSTGMVQDGQGGSAAVVAQIYHILQNNLEIFQYPKPFIKASGGIKTWQHAKKLLEIGVKRIGTSQSLTILKEFENA